MKAHILGSIFAFILQTSINPVSAAPNGVVFSRQDEPASLDGTLSLDNTADVFIFDYSTRDPYSTNWIGLYRASGGGPVNQEYVAPSLVWSYAPKPEGSVHLSTDGLDPGQYQAYFLARDGYKWLAQPLDVTLEAPPANLSFPVDSATLKNARQSEKYQSKVGGLVLGKGDDAVTFTKVSGDRWISVSKDGTIAGTPSMRDSGASQVIIRATAGNGSTATMRFTIPVRRARERLVGDLKVMTFNLWHGGTQVNDYHAKQLRYLLNSNVDVVALQEAAEHTARIATALGWDYYDSSDVGIISRYPIAEKYGALSASGGVRIDIEGTRKSFSPSEINIWSAHLGYTPYGPYDFCYDHMTPEQVSKREAQSGRTPQITDIMKGLKPYIKNASQSPVLLAGDFNAPSHLDWIPSLTDKNCGVASFDWPSSIIPAKGGMIDSFRVAYPDPKAEQATTWSPLYPRHDGNTGDPEPQDRIDFVYHANGSKMKVAKSERLIVGNPAPYPNHRDNEWTSDHAAVMTTYRFEMKE